MDLDFVRNPYFALVVALLLALYASMAVPSLSARTMALFDQPVFRFGVQAFILFLAAKSPQIAIMAAVSFGITMSLVNQRKMQEAFVDFERRHAARRQ